MQELEAGIPFDSKNTSLLAPKSSFSSSELYPFLGFWTSLASILNPNAVVDLRLSAHVAVGEGVGYPHPYPQLIHP